MEHPENNEEYKGLQVNSGVVPLPSVNPYATFRRKKRMLTVDEYVAGIRRGDISILGQAVTLVESSLPSDQEAAQKVIEACLPFSGNSQRVGITGVPGVFVAVLYKKYLPFSYSYVSELELSVFL